MFKIHSSGLKSVFFALMNLNFEAIVTTITSKFKSTRTKNTSFLAPKTKFKHTLRYFNSKKMDKKKRLIRGLDNYQQFINGNGYFVDKTLFIKEIVDNEHNVVLIPRPRRFGKSLNLSMLSYFFDITQKDTAKLFRPYKIWKTGKTYTEQQGSYPVIKLTLKDIKEDNFKECLEFLKEIISDLYAEHEYLLESTFLNKRDKKQFEQVLDRAVSTTVYKRSLKKLSHYLYLHHQKQVVILVDEYDSPIHAGYRNGYFKEIISFMKSFLGGVFKTNDALYKGVITGVLRVSKESIFSDLNNIGVYTLLDYGFADKFGFTQTETKALLDHFQLGSNFELVKKWYDGYKIGNLEDLYNPWSITGYIGQHEQGFKDHWVNTSSDELIKERIMEKNATAIRSDIEALLLGNTITKQIDKNIIFADFETNKELLWSLLVFAGYLTPVKAVQERFYELSIPNYEIKTLFQKIIRGWLERGLNIRSSLLLQMVDSLTHNRIKEFERHFQSIMGDTFSYFDIDKNPENIWQTYVLGLLAITEEDYLIKSNRESGDGRYDILMLPKDSRKYRIIFEIKTMNKTASKKQIKEKLEEALKQIEKNEYYKELVAHQITKRIELAMAFVGKKVYLLSKNT